MMSGKKTIIRIYLVFISIFLINEVANACGGSGGGGGGGDQPPIIQPIATTTNFSYACQHLGIDSINASNALHSAKESIGWRGDCIFDLSNGNIIVGGEIIGNLGD